MSFGTRMRARREELRLTRAELAEELGVSPSAVSNYENDLSSPKEEILLRLFDALQVDPNYLYHGSYHASDFTFSHAERELIEKYRMLSSVGRQTVHTIMDALRDYRDEIVGELGTAETETRVIPLYRTPAAAGYASPVFGEDFDYLTVDETVPRGAEFAVRIQGDSMEPEIADGSVIYVNRDPMENGDVGIFWVDGDMLCKQYYHDPLGMTYLFSLNRERADADVVFSGSSGRTLVCFGRVILPHRLPLPAK
ncbi:MAG: LexA family transcriptional regulator [Oscillospiraceae bacterium]|nr:LexA family transcriptional regulator [Oscillospiraceae bacterium]MBQ1742129.1 LexA family transcriptional regulator [Oscillospiraceae bacterium]MBQ1834422.1 LexA family transcriptional regulator [Oscillospiraceae bacterium]MBQ2223700.1 LexA family transcriptional regulator [Oscillospiraceae bacterium]